MGSVGCKLLQPKVDTGGWQVSGERGEYGSVFSDLPTNTARIIQSLTAQHVPEQPAFRPDSGGWPNRLLKTLGMVAAVDPSARTFGETGSWQPPVSPSRQR